VMGAGGARGAGAGGAGARGATPPRPLAAGFAAWALLALPLLALATPLPTLTVAAGYGLGLAGISFGTALWQTTLQRLIPHDVLARVSSYDWLVSFVFVPIGFIAIGPLANSIGIATTLVVAACGIAATNVLVAVTPPVRGVRRADAEAPAVRAAPEPRAAA